MKKKITSIANWRWMLKHSTIMTHIYVMSSIPLSF